MELTIGGQRPDPLTKDWPCNVVLYNVHNHEMESNETLRFRELGPEVKALLCELYKKGHGVPSALQSLRMDYMFKYPEEIYHSVCADGHYMPSVSICHHLFRKRFTKQYNSCLVSLKSLIDDYNTRNRSGRASFCQLGNHVSVIICTPLMRRISDNNIFRQDKNSVMLESYGFLDKKRPRIYLFSTSTIAGYLPLACILVDQENDQTFENAVQKLSEDFPTIFSSSFTFLTDSGDIKKVQSLKKVWPDVVVSQSQVSFSKFIWTWLTNKRNEIDPSHTERLYQLVKDVIFATNEKEIEASRVAFMTSDITQRYPHFLHQMDNVLTRQDEWNQLLKSQISLGSATYIDAGFNILKECIFRCVKSFKFQHLIDFMLTKFELFVQHWLVTFSLGKRSHNLISRFHEQPCNISELTIKDAGIKGCFFVQHNNNNNTVDISRQMVDIQIGVCTCQAGSFKLCPHMVGALKKCLTSTNEHLTCPSDCCSQILKVAIGREAEEEVEDDEKEGESRLKQHDESDTASDSNIQSGSSVSIHKRKHDDNFSKNHTKNNLSRVGVRTETDCDKLLKDFDINITNKIRKGLKQNPRTFVPALKKMLSNFQKTGKSDEALLMAMNNFATKVHHQTWNYAALAEECQTDSCNNHKKPKLTTCSDTNQKVELPFQLRHHDYTSLQGPTTITTQEKRHF